jgi:hypothetical protein
MHIIGADANASIGIRPSYHSYDIMPSKHESDLDIDPICKLLGPHGNPHKSKTGNGILNLMREHNLRATATFFDNNHKYNTWLGLPNPATGKRRAYQIDHIFVPHQQLGQTTNVKRKFNGVNSDHVAMPIEFKLLNTPFKRNNQQRNQIIREPTPKIDNYILKGEGLSSFQTSVNNFFANLSPTDAIFHPPSEILDNFEKHIVECAKNSALTQKRSRPDWFSKMNKIS